MAPPKKSFAKKQTNNKPPAKSAAKAVPATKAAPAPKPAAKTVKETPAQAPVVKAMAAAAAPAAVAAAAPPPPIAIPPLPLPPVNIKDEAAIQAYQDLYDQFGNLRWQLTNIDDIDRIKEARDQVYDILTALNKAKLAANTAAYAALLPAIDDSNHQLDGIRKEIATIVKNIAIAGTVALSITRVLSIAAKL